MEHRIIIRFSLNGDDGTDTTDIRNRLEALGFSRIGTSSYENRHVNGENLGQIMTTVASIAQPTIATLDHMWVYVDSPE